MLATSLVLGDTSTSPRTGRVEALDGSVVGYVEVDGLSIQSCDADKLRDLADALSDAADMAVKP